LHLKAHSGPVERDRPVRMARVDQVAARARGRLGSLEDRDRDGGQHERDQRVAVQAVVGSAALRVRGENYVSGVIAGHDRQNDDVEKTHRREVHGRVVDVAQKGNGEEEKEERKDEVEEMENDHKSRLGALP